MYFYVFYIKDYLVITTAILSYIYNYAWEYLITSAHTLILLLDLHNSLHNTLLGVLQSNHLHQNKHKLNSMNRYSKEDRVYPKTFPFYTQHLIWVNYKFVSQLYQPTLVSFSYLNSSRHNLVIELCRALQILFFLFTFI